MYLLLASALILAFGVLFYLTTLKRCDSNEVLIVSGKLFGKNKGKTVAVYQGGTINVLPLVQQVQYLSLIPMNIDVELRSALSQNNIRVDVPSNFQIAFSDDVHFLENAAKRLVGLDVGEIEELALDIILGGMRAVIASLTIEEINSNREKFMTEIENQVKPELDKLGLIITNVNIQDINDEAGYIKAIGQKAASGAVERARIEVSEQERMGAIGTAKEETNKKVGVAETEKERTVAIAKFESETEREKIEYEKQKVNAKAELEVERAKASQMEKVAESQAQQAILSEEKIQKQLEMEKETIVQEEIQKRQVILKAEAQAAEITAKAKAEADATLMKAKAEAEGTKAILEAKAEGYKKMFEGVDPNCLLGMEYLKIAKDLQEINVEAIAGLSFGEINVIDSGNGKSVPNFLQGFLGSLPMAHQMSQNLGIELPGFMGKKESKESESETDK